MFRSSLHPLRDATASGDLQTAVLLRSFLSCFTLKQSLSDAGDRLSRVKSMTAFGKHVLPTSALVSFFTVDNMEVSLRCFGGGGSVSAEELQEELCEVVGKVFFEESCENMEELGSDPTFVECNEVLKQFVPPFALGGFPDVQVKPRELYASAVLMPPGFFSILESSARQAAELEELLVLALCGPVVK